MTDDTPPDDRSHSTIIPLWIKLCTTALTAFILLKLRRADLDMDSTTLGPEPPYCGAPLDWLGNAQCAAPSTWELLLIEVIVLAAAFALQYLDGGQDDD